MPQNQVVSTYLYQNQTSILTDIYNFGKSTSNLRNDEAQILVIFDLFVPNSQRYIDIYFAIFLRHKSKSHYDVQTSRIRYLFDTKITILYHIICIFLKEFKFTSRLSIYRIKKKQIRTELDSDQDPPKTPQDPCRRPSER